MKKEKRPISRHPLVRVLIIGVFEVIGRASQSSLDAVFRLAQLFAILGCRLGNRRMSSEDCRIPHNARPAPEAMGVDLFSTVKRCGYEIEVLSDYSQEMNRFGMLLIR